MDADGHAARMDQFGGLQRPDDKNDEVGRHHHRRGVLDAATAVVERGLGDFAHVGDGEMVGIDDQRCLEGRLVFGLVPARKQRRASVDWNWVVAIVCSVPSSAVYVDR